MVGMRGSDRDGSLPKPGVSLRPAETAAPAALHRKAHRWALWGLRWEPRIHVFTIHLDGLSPRGNVDPASPRRSG